MIQEYQVRIGISFLRYEELLIKQVERQMDSLQDQVFALNIKVDALHQKLEQVSYQTADVLSFAKRLSESSNRDQAESGRQTYQSYLSRGTIDSDMEHKDILADVNYPDSDSQGIDHALTPEIQIQRLTAQLTAAYNRIAALEEQLMAKRIH